MRIDLRLQRRKLTLLLRKRNDIILIDQLLDIADHLVEAACNLSDLILRCHFHLLVKISLRKMRDCIAYLSEWLGHKI